MTASEAPVRVGWVGEPPAWLGGEEARAALGGVAVSALAPGEPVDARAFDLLHVAAGPAAAPPGVPLVVEYAAERPPRRRARRALERAAAVVVPSTRARRAVSFLGDRVLVVRPPVDLDRHAPADELRERERRDFSRFLRFHRLGPPTVLFAGPYDAEGGLLETVEAALRLRSRFADLRLAAVPLGAVDARYRDRCERAALALGHRGLVAWERPGRELPYWFAAATVLAVPYRAEDDDEALLLAGAAAVPAVVADRDGDALAEAVAALLDDPARAAESGAAARRAALATLAPSFSAARLGDAWRFALRHGPARGRAGSRAPRPGPLLRARA